MSLILPTSSPPDAEARRIAQATIRRLGTKLRHTMTVPLGDALWTNVVRAIMRGLMLITGQSANHSIAGGADDAFERLSKHTSTATPSKERLTKALTTLCKTLGVAAVTPSSRRDENRDSLSSTTSSARR